VQVVISGEFHLDGTASRRAPWRHMQLVHDKEPLAFAVFPSESSYSLQIAWHTMLLTDALEPLDMLYGKEWRRSNRRIDQLCGCDALFRGAIMRPTSSRSNMPTAIFGRSAAMQCYSIVPRGEKVCEQRKPGPRNPVCSIRCAKVSGHGTTVAGLRSPMRRGSGDLLFSTTRGIRRKWGRLRSPRSCPGLPSRGSERINAEPGPLRDPVPVPRGI
jgi:hypothetical protein